MERHLTNTEIEDILDFIKPNQRLPLEMDNSVILNNKNRLIKQLKQQKINPKIIPELKNQIKDNYFRSRVSPGESVGILAAQSIGERQTQNSVVYGEEILVKKNDKIWKTTVGQLIDQEIKDIIPDEYNNYIKQVKNIQVLTVSQDEKIEWKYVKEISKHPTNGDLIQVTTESGRSVTTTLAHSHLKKVENGIEPILGSDLKLGDRIPVIKKSPKEDSNFKTLFITKFINYIQKDNEDNIILCANFHTKRLDTIIFDSNDSVKIRLIKSFIQLNGFLNNKKEVLIDYQMLLTQFGILANISPSLDFGYNLYIQQKYIAILSNLIKDSVPKEIIYDNFEEDYPLPICCITKNIIDCIYDVIYETEYAYNEADNIAKSIYNVNWNNIKLVLKERFEILKRISIESQNDYFIRIIDIIDKKQEKDIIWDKIVSLKLISEKDYKYDYVYDFSVQGNETFALFSGIVVHNTLNSIDWKENILYMQNKECIVEPIGKMIDNLLLKYPENIEKIAENRTEYLPLEDGYFIPSCDEHGNTDWYQIEAITRHLPVGDLVKVTTESGREVMATQSKSFLVWNEEEKKFLATKGSDIKIGDILPTTEGLPRFKDHIQTHFKYINIDIELDREFGFIIGLYLTNLFDTFRKEDDKINKRVIDFIDKYSIDNILLILNHITKDLTEIPSFSYIASEEFIKGLLSGYYRNCEYTDSGSIICKINNELLLNSISFLLNYFGIIGMYTKEDVFLLEVNKNYTKTLEMNVLEEIWKDLPKELLLSKYEISNNGRLRNKLSKKISIRKQDINGYIRAHLCLDNNLRKDFSYHKLCLISFKNIMSDKIIDHINNIRDDNRISNLRWVTYTENNTNKIFKYQKGKSIIQYDLDGNFIKIWDKISDVVKELGITNQNISANLKTKQKSAGGFIWKYNIINFDGEIWKKFPIDNSDEIYVSSLGRIKRRNDDSTISYGSLKKNGYCEIIVDDKHFFIHRMVAITFIENPDNKLYVNHKDSIKNNNKVENLEWISHVENVNYSLNLKNRLSNNVLSNIILQIDIKTDKIVNEYLSFSVAMKTTGIKGVKNCCYGNRKTAGGYKWCIKEKEITKNTIENKFNVYFDKVINIEYVNGTTEFVYDLTVEKTKNFQLFNGLNIRDTFHKAGQSESSVTVGVKFCSSDINIYC